MEENAIILGANYYKCKFMLIFETYYEKLSLKNYEKKLHL